MTGQTGPGRIEGRFHPRSEAADVASHFNDGARNLMAERHRLAYRKISHGAAMVVMQVGAANSAERDADADLIGRERSVLDLLDPQILFAVANRSEHQTLLPQECVR